MVRCASAKLGLGLILPLLCQGTICAGQEVQESVISSRPSSIWKSDPGSGFKKGTTELDAGVGGGVGLVVLGSENSHDWWLGMMDYGWVFTDVVGEGHWYRGNWELLGEVFGGRQFHPSGSYIFGGGPHFRYNFATGHAWVPFFDLGGGVTATDIRDGDLSTTFEFNLQAGPGVHVFLRDDLAVTGQVRLIHLSNAYLSEPNQGVNTLTFLIGVTWFF